MKNDSGSRLIVLLSVQRSGTNFFRRVLGSHPDVDPLFGEVFDPFWKNEPLMFFNYYAALVSAEPKYALPENRAEAFQAFIKFCSSKAEKRNMIFDIKYNSMFHIESYWMSHEPVVVRLLRDGQYPIIHLIRNDLVGAVLSVIMAKKTGIYLIRKGDARPRSSQDETIPVDPPSFVNQIKQRAHEIQRYRNMLLQYKNSIEIVYENLSEGEAVSIKPLEKVGQLCALEPSLFEREHPIKKIITKPAEEFIENYDDVEAELSRQGVSRYFFGKKEVTV